ncbi:MAG: 50S ribosome-binding GTPase [Betaproteobacteria bacterium]|nr:50S ribosome-binding GTPase [Betaproteobacteria bacterium]
MGATLDTLRFTTAGSVDDGKSTLIGRLLYDAKSIFEDQLASIERTSTKRGGERVDLSLLTDGLTAEREQGITIDVAYRYFTSAKRRFIIADTPGHEQYTRNMVTGASTADLTVVLVDAAKGLQTQSRRHAIIASLLGIPHVVLAVNKMDAVGYSQSVFEAIRAEFTAFCRDLDIAELDFIPVSALEGDMVVERGENLGWYRGPTLLELLENSKAAEAAAGEFRFPVQRVALAKFGPQADTRGYQGRIESGRVAVGDRIAVLPSGHKARVQGIVTLDGALDAAAAPQSVTLLLDTQLDISRGDLFAHAGELPTVTHRLVANLAWMAREPLDVANGKPQRYLIKHTTQSVRALVEAIDFRLDVNTLARDTGVTTFQLNDIGRVRLKTQKPLAVDSYRANRATGSFILIDEATHQTVAAGMIQAEGENPNG